jgi:hypothetical protein
MYTHYYYFKFDPQTRHDVLEITDLISQFNTKDVIQVQADRIVVMRATADITDLLENYIKDKFTQNVEIEVQVDKPRHAYMLQYDRSTKLMTTQYLVAFFKASYLYEAFSVES